LTCRTCLSRHASQQTRCCLFATPAYWKLRDSEKSLSCARRSRWKVKKPSSLRTSLQHLRGHHPPGRREPTQSLSFLRYAPRSNHPTRPQRRATGHQPWLPVRPVHVSWMHPAWSSAPLSPPVHFRRSARWMAALRPIRRRAGTTGRWKETRPKAAQQSRRVCPRSSVLPRGSWRGAPTVLRRARHLQKSSHHLLRSALRHRLHESLRHRLHESLHHHRHGNRHLHHRRHVLRAERMQDSAHKPLPRLQGMKTGSCRRWISSYLYPPPNDDGEPGRHPRRFVEILPPSYSMRFPAQPLGCSNLSSRRCGTGRSQTPTHEIQHTGFELVSVGAPGNMGRMLVPHAAEVTWDAAG
jgi:hypothetical protein